MQTKRLFAKVLLVGLFVVLLSSSAAAITLDLAPPPATYQGQSYTGGWYGAVGNDRGVLFDAVQPFTLNSVGIEINLSGFTTLTASLYAVSGKDTVGVLLASKAQAVTDLGRSWYDVPLGYNFPGGNRYLLSIGFVLVPSEAVFYDFEGRGDLGQPIDPPYTVGPVSVFDGTYNLAGPNYMY